MNFSQITDNLFIGTTPSRKDYARLRELNVRLVINMRFTYGPRPDHHIPPLLSLWLRTIDSLFFPIPVAKLMVGARAALETIRLGGKVYVHCAYGRHRGPAMGSCILIAQGYEPESAMDLIMTQRLVANPKAYYIRPRILQFAHQWNNS